MCAGARQLADRRVLAATSRRPRPAPSARLTGQGASLPVRVLLRCNRVGLRTREQQVVLLRAHGVGLLGMLPDPRDDPELFQFSCRLSINTLQALLLPVVYPQGVYTYPAL